MSGRMCSTIIEGIKTHMDALLMTMGGVLLPLGFFLLAEYDLSPEKESSGCIRFRNMILDKTKNLCFRERQGLSRLHQLQQYPSFFRRGFVPEHGDVLK